MLFSKPQGLFTIGLLLGLLFFASCSKEKVEYPWSYVTLPGLEPKTDIHFLSSNQGFISGGENWQSGEILETDDGGETWQQLYSGERVVSALDSDINGRLHFNGYSGLYGRDQDDLNIYELLTFHPYDDISTHNGEHIFSVSGQSLVTGTITEGNAYGDIFKNDEFIHDLEAIDHADENNITVCGHGQIVFSNDKGQSWKILPYTGDYFKDVHFPTPTTGYICGFSGSILKSEDGGANWEFLRDGDKLLVKDKRFRALHFENESHGYIVGNGGLCWRTTNGGDSWEVIKKLPNEDFTGVFVFDSHAFIVSEEGNLIRVNHF